MSKRNFDVDYLAELQVDSLPPPERKELAKLFSIAEMERSAETWRTAEGQFISRLGSRRRVLWKRSPAGRPIILSIVDQSYAA